MPKETLRNRNAINKQSPLLDTCPQIYSFAREVHKEGRPSMREQYEDI